jgi:pSer/pThr/pTyr-binding forkhead associated (FHA) protein
MSELTLTLIKLGFLAVLWLFVLSAVSVIRSDIFGARVDQAQARQPKPAKAPKQPKPGRAARSTPRALIVTEGPNAGQTVPLDGAPLLIGRGTDAALRLDDDDYVSTRHARIATNGEQWFVEDLGSTNGTFLGSQRVTAPVPIGVGTPVRVGKTVVELRK